MIFYSKSEFDHCSSIGIVYKERNKIGYFLVNFCPISKIHATFWQELSHKSEPVFKIKIRLSKLKW